MPRVKEELEAYGLKVYESEAPDRERVDFSISDGTDNVAFVWGDSPDNVEVECDHPYECVEFGSDIEDQGECLLCGAYCDWHYENDGEGHGVPEPHDWYRPRHVKGFIKEYIEEQEASYDKETL